MEKKIKEVVAPQIEKPVAKKLAWITGKGASVPIRKNCVNVC